MVLADNLNRQHYDSYGSSCIADSHNETYKNNPNFMADKPQPSHTQEDLPGCDKAAEEPETSRKAAHDGGGGSSGWLQLGLAGDISPNEPTTTTSNIGLVQQQIVTSSAELTELDLFHDRPRPPAVQEQEIPSSSNAPSIAQTQPVWFPAVIGGYRGGSSSSSYMPRLPLHSHNWGQGQVFWPSATSSSSPSSSSSIAGDLRVVSPPARPQAGLWLQLLAAPNQVKEPFLPQIPKSYLRIKDGRLTIRLLMKYIANKLGLDDDSEVDITCTGQQLHPSMTLQYVRDNLWHSTEAVELMYPTDPSTTNHIMTLNYSRNSG